ncbi:g-protein coupled receptor Mth2 [Caerostris extrusa]|uniref:G-protein coupled receptor Mth2 n=1 Tax=Caerostris extrusa TaxID=172846 RepID=A0AAV4RD75_CAEEX|nr:g-protein coupled receptor Mth2 [Caerostris extrusa]
MHLGHLQSMRLPASMRLCCIFIFLAVFLIRPSDARVSFNFAEVQELGGKSCPQLDSCKINITVGNYTKANCTREESCALKDWNCACDELCAEYGDCCVDSDWVTTRPPSLDLNCLEMTHMLDDGVGVYMKDTCPPGYEGPDELRRLCEDVPLNNMRDPLGSLPISDALTGVTFKNYYCGICNDKRDNMVFWAPRLDCPTVTLLDTNNETKNLSQEFIFQNLEFKSSNWGLFLNGENGSLFFHDCTVEPMMPVGLQDKIRLCRSKLVKDCPSDWEDEDTSTMCKSYMAARFIIEGFRFRNPHCALCNGQNLTELSCHFRDMRHLSFRKFDPQAFALLLDFNLRSGEVVGKYNPCSIDEIYDPFFKKCRSVVCLPGYVRRGGKCELDAVLFEKAIPSYVKEHERRLALNNSEVANETAVEEKLREESEQLSKVLEESSKGSFNSTEAMLNESLKQEVGLFMDCLLITLSDEEYFVLENGSVYVPKYDRVYEPTSYYAADGSALICSHEDLEGETKFMPALGYITIIGLSISMLCLLFHFVAFWIVPDLQNLSGKCLVSQCSSLLLAYTFFIIGLFHTLDSSSCSFIGFLTFYFFQVTFFWMAAIAYDVWRTLKMATTELRVATGKQLKRFLTYSFFSWISPLFIVGFLALTEFTDLLPSSYKPGFSSPLCWFKSKLSLLVFFVAPLALVMLVNIVMFLSSSRMILMTTQTAVKQQSQAQRRNFKLYLRLALLMGLTWIVGIVAGYVDIEALWYLFVVLNTLQGLFIFIAFTCSTKVLKYLKDKAWKTTRAADYKSTTHSASTGSTQSTNLHSSLAKKFTSKLMLRQKDSTSTTQSSSINSCQTNSPI